MQSIFMLILFLDVCLIDNIVVSTNRYLSDIYILSLVVEHKTNTDCLIERSDIRSETQTVIYLKASADCSPISVPSVASRSLPFRVSSLSPT